MDNFKYKDREVKTDYFTGEVINTSKHSETYVTSSGGGGYVGPDGGHVNAPQVSSSTVTCHEFWIRQDDGRERSVSLRGYDIPLRAGQRVTMVMASDARADYGHYTTLVNHTADRHWNLMDGADVNRKLALTPLNLMALVLLIFFSGLFLQSLLVKLPEFLQQQPGPDAMAWWAVLPAFPIPLQWWPRVLENSYLMTHLLPPLLLSLVVGGWYVYRRVKASRGGVLGAVLGGLFLIWIIQWLYMGVQGVMFGGPRFASASAKVNFLPPEGMFAVAGFWLVVFVLAYLIRRWLLNRRLQRYLQEANQKAFGMG
ncbi:MAG: hypothetical protein EA348_02800 [Pseudomonadaceae bacterium]|nr:MAG: hypothetical protein EA348_02800 [Pseudomonadaceae bacterium]